MSSRGIPTVVIFHIGSIGDTVVMLPCLHAIARQYPGHRRILLTNNPDSARASSAESVLDGSGLIDGAEYFPPRLASFRAAGSLIRRLRASGAATLVYLVPRTSMRQVHRDRLFFRLGGIREFIGMPVGAADLDRRLEADGRVEPEAQFLARSLSQHLPVDLGAANWSLNLSSREMAVDALLSALPGGQPIVALCPGAKWVSKDWGEDRWAELVRRLDPHARHLSLILVGAADERELSQRILHRWQGPALNLCGALTPRQTAGVLRRCDLLVCHDSGPMHLAATQGTRCVALFGNRNKPRQWYPWGNQHRIFHEPRGVTHISVDSVAAAVMETIGEAGARGRPRQAQHLQVVR